MAGSSGTSFRLGAGLCSGVVPDLPAYLVEGSGGPPDHMKGIRAADRLGAAFRHHIGDPLGLIGRNVGD